ncbi:MAG TPA: class I SAM-dependent methyltransferase [Steroidobacteraceae bacterium]|nr:class I SAM-dependent methyltransferase [Steroidobacteraceae bacterium]
MLTGNTGAAAPEQNSASGLHPDISLQRADASRHGDSRLQYLNTRAADADFLATAIKRQAQGHLEILEAGCGRKWPVKLDGVDYTLTGIDLDPEALAARLQGVGDLHDAIVGDLCTPGLIPANKFDVIYSSFVLEHIKDAEIALENMVAGLKRGGILVLRIPDPYSAHGWTAHHTPFSVHVAYYRYVMGNKNAGKPGFAPYPTFYAKVVSRQGIRDFCEQHDCTLLEERGTTYYLEKKNLVTFASKIYVQALYCLSLGSLAWRHNNLAFVIRKN